MSDNVVSFQVKNSVEGRVAKLIVNNADKIAHALMNGKDVEIRKTSAGISVTELRKRIIVK